MIVGVQHRTAQRNTNFVFVVYSALCGLQLSLACKEYKYLMVVTFYDCTVDMADMEATVITVQSRAMLNGTLSWSDITDNLYKPCPLL